MQKIKILTFYSYKGGVGRTQLLANMASYLAIYKDKKVLLIDWDLEAPGLDTFFNVDRKEIKKGLIELLHEYTHLVKTDDDVEIDELPKISSDYMIPVIEDRVFLMPAGNYNEDYNEKIRTFNWEDFYNNLSGKMYIEFLKDELKKSDFDYIFIDSRTGINDYSGICNVQMPDANIIVVAPTIQNIEGSFSMAKTIINSPYTKEEFRTPLVIPILSRLDTTETEASVWFEKFREKFNPMINSFMRFLAKEVDLSRDLTNNFIEKTLLEYKTGISFGEKILFKDIKEEIKPITLENKFQEIAEIIENINSGINTGTSDFIKRLETEKEKIPKFLTEIPKFDASRIIERGEIVKDIENQIQTVSEPLLVSGIGGSGKTTLVKSYVFRYRDSYNHIAWIDASNNLKEAFALNEPLLHSLKIGTDYLHRHDKDYMESVLNQIFTKLMQLKGNNLLIIDNVNDEINKRGFLKTLQQLKQWKVIITSRLILSDFNNYNLGDLPPEIARQIFKNHYSGETNSEELDLLFELIGYHTLTIELLAKTLEDNFTINGVSDLIRYIKDNKLSDEEWQISVNIPYSDKERNIFRHLMNAFRLVGMTDYQKWVLAQFAVLPSIDIHGRDLLQYLNIQKEDRRKFVDSLKYLTERGWLQNRLKHYFYAHPIIKEVVKNKVKPSASKCRDLINWFLGRLEMRPEDNPLSKRSIVPFAESLVRNIETWDSDIAKLANQLGYLYIYIGDYQKSLNYHLRAIKIREKLLPLSHPMLAQSYYNIAFTYYCLKDYNKALAYNQKAIDIREKTLPAGDVELALSYNNLASVYSNLNKFDKSLTYHKKALAILEKTLDPMHPDLAQSYNNIAVTYSNIGDFEKSLDYDKKAIEIREKVLENNHPDLALSYYNIASTYKDLNDYDKSLEYDIKAIKIRENILDSPHPVLAQSYNNIAVTYHSMENFEKATEYQLKAISIQEKLLPGSKHDLALSYHNLAGTYYNKGDFESALNYNQKALEIRKDFCIEKSPDLASTYNNLANSYYKLKNYEEALNYYIKAINIFENIKETNKHDLALIYHNIGAAYYLKGEYQNALKYDMKALMVRQEILKPDEPEIALSYHNIAMASYKVKDYKSAKMYIDKALEIRRKALPDNHPDFKKSLDWKNDIDMNNE